MRCRYRGRCSSLGAVWSASPAPSEENSASPKVCSQGLIGLTAWPAAAILRPAGRHLISACHDVCRARTGSYPPCLPADSIPNLEDELIKSKQ